MTGSCVERRRAILRGAIRCRLGLGAGVACGIVLSWLVLAATPAAAQQKLVAKPKPLSVWDAKADALVERIMEPGIQLEIDPRRSMILRTKRAVTRVSVTNPDILEVVQFSPTEFELIGGQTGQTSLTFWFGDGDKGGEMLRYLVKVSPNEAIEDRRKTEYGDLEKKINELFPNSVVQLIPIADKLIVRGQARDAEEATQILALVRGEGGDGSGIGITHGILNRGPAADPFPGTASLPSSNVINLLHVPGEQQVMLKVRVAELSRTALRQMGATFHWNQGDFTFDSLLGLGVDGVVSAVLETEDVRLTLQALATNSYGKVLAEPNLVTLSGHSAYFIAGGEFAVPAWRGPRPRPRTSAASARSWSSPPPCSTRTGFGCTSPPRSAR